MVQRTIINERNGLIETNIALPLGSGDGAKTDEAVAPFTVYLCPPSDGAYARAAAADVNRGYLNCSALTLTPPSSGDITPANPDVDDILTPVDHWALPEIAEDTRVPWKELSCGERLKLVVFGYCMRIVALFGLLYLFICSLGLLGDAFRLLGGKAAGEALRDSVVLANPVCGLMIGVLATVLLQSSSTSTSIVVGLVSSEILPVRTAIPIVMGANIGTSMTNTLVSMAHSGRRHEFRRAFAGATVHDMFNWLAVSILLPLEAACGYLYHSTAYVIGLLNIEGKHKKPPKLLKHLTEPLTKRIVQLDKNVIKAVAMSEVGESGAGSLIKRFCGSKIDSSVLLAANETSNLTEELLIGEDVLTPCNHLFAETSLSDATVGLILLAASLALLIGCLLCIVKLLHSMLRGRIARAIRKSINNDLPGYLAPLTGYVTIVVGAALTILVQSSSVFTSALTPLVGVGVLSLERMYPLTLGANVGTTFTSVLAALASPPDRLASSLQIALCHLFFNLTGILLFYPIPATRQAPIGLAKFLGEQTAKYRWVAGLYIALMFFMAPATVFALSMAGTGVLLSVGIPILALAFFIAVVNVMQNRCPKALPPFLRSWTFLPPFLRSLQPYDSLLDGLLSLCPFCSSGWPCLPTTAASDPEAPSTAAASRVGSRGRLLPRATSQL